MTADNGYRHFGESFDRYMKSIGSIQRISVAEEIALSTIIKNDKDEKKVRDAVDKLVVSNLLLVVKFAINYYKFVNKGNFELSIMDLIGQGNLGLFTAASGFDSDKGKFSTYASHYIKRWIQNERHLNRFIRLPVNYFTIVHAVRKEMTEKQNIEMTEATDEILLKIAKKHDSNLAHVKFVMSCYEKSVSSVEQTMDSPSYDDGDNKNNGILDRYPSDEKPLDEIIGEKESRAYLFEKIKTLSSSERDIVTAKYFGEEGVTCQDLAEIWGVSKQRISQILISALKKLKAKISEDRVTGGDL